ncbi:hypothetical protein N7536_003638 [Penicillium majusculum]|nr:hypothetical protein N7536_003638 [Penicillium majusculum]
MGTAESNPIFPSSLELDISGKSRFFAVITYEYGPLADSYLKNLVESEVRTLDELIKWNEAHPELELPKDCQSRLIAARDQVPSPADYNAVISNLEKVTVDLGAIFESHGIDLIVVLTDSRISSLASASASGRSYNNPQEYPLD